MLDARPTTARLLSSLAIVLAASAALAPTAVDAASPGPAACQEYSVCGGPTGPGNGGAAASGRSQPHQRAEPSPSGWFRVPLVDYPVTPAVAVLGATLLGLAVALGVVARLRARPPTATHPS